MKIRLLVYSSILFLIFALPVVYKGIDSNLQKQEKVIRKRKEDWLTYMFHLEVRLTRKFYDDSDKYWFHYFRVLNYGLSWCKMAQEDLDNILKELNAL